jgi:hypothetical protein
MSDRRLWSREETLAAFALYCRTPFGRLHARNPEIVELAGRLHRTPSALAMKCVNLASLDETHRRRGVCGLSNISRVEREIWEAFTAAPEAVAYEAALALARAEGVSPPMAEELTPPDVRGIDREARTRVRVNQCFFREMILASYQESCTVCELPIARLLVASHIVPWAADASIRMNPRNGLCLCGTHDLSFERGFLLIDPHYCMHMSAKVEPHRTNPAVQQWLLRYEGRTIRMPDRWAPDPELLQRRLAMSEQDS